MTSTIQIWNSYGPVNIEPTTITNKFCIEIRKASEKIPEELEKKIDENWEKNCIKNPKAKNNPILYLAKPLEAGKGRINAVTEERGFKYTQALNRDEILTDPSETLRKYKLLSISTHCHLVTKDNKLLFGTKKNQSNQISGFSGFPNVQEDSIEIVGKKFLKIYETMQNRLRPEIGYLVDAICSIDATGITYVSTPGLRGLDFNYLVKIDETASNIEKRFKENWQFKKELFTVDFEPDRMIEFAKKIHSDDKVMSRYALGCMYQETKAFFEEKDADKLLKTIREDIGVSMSTNNETDYFS